MDLATGRWTVIENSVNKNYDGHSVRPVVIDNGWLQCPECSQEYLYHRETRVIERFTEDSDGTVVTVNDHNVSLKTIETKRIPGRRDCVEIDFQCESCGEGSPVTLRITQHKGLMLVNWAEATK
jgi:hypothetical protein